ncbi:MAG TPA: restriction endonuclease [Myxococcales bacterium]|nr:restriction endonuclease [Myxococcales bacterium]
MGIIIIGVGGLVVGFLLITLISITAPRPEDDPANQPAAGDQAPHAWIAQLDAEELGKLLSLLFAELKFDVQDTRVSGNVVDLFAVNPTPITGGRIYIRGVCFPPLGLVNEEEVRTALETARAEMAGKALVATGGGFAPEARAAAEGAPLELLDGASLLSLVKKHLPPVAVARRV